MNSAYAGMPEQTQLPRVITLKEDNWLSNLYRDTKDNIGSLGVVLVFLFVIWIWRTRK